MHFRLRFALLLILLIGAVLACWYALRDDGTDQLRQLAAEALRENCSADAERLAAQLQERGRQDEARLIRAEVCVRTGRALLERRALLARGDQAETLAQVALTTLTPLLSPAAGPIGFSALHQPLNWPPVLVAQPRGLERRTLAARGEAAFLQATRELRQVSEGPHYAAATLLLAEAFTSLAELGRPAPLTEVVRRLHLVTNAQPDDLEAHRRLAQIYIDLNAVRPALAELQEVARLDPADGRPCRFMGLVLRDTLREGEAIDAYSEALRRQLQPHVMVETREELAQLLVNQGFPEKALDVLVDTPKSFRESVPGLVIEASALWSLNRRAGALRLVEAALNADSTYPSAIRLRAQMYLTEEQPLPAQKLLEGLLKGDPSDEKAQHLLIDALRMSGDTAAMARESKQFDETTARLKELTELGRLAHGEPWNAEVRLRIATILLELGRKPEARSWLRATLAADPRSTEAQRLLTSLDAGR